MVSFKLQMTSLEFQFIESINIKKKLVSISIGHFGFKRVGNDYYHRNFILMLLIVKGKMCKFQLCVSSFNDRRDACPTLEEEIASSLHSSQ